MLQEKKEDWLSHLWCKASLQPINIFLSFFSTKCKLLSDSWWHRQCWHRGHILPVCQWLGRPAVSQPDQDQFQQQEQVRLCTDRQRCLQTWPDWYVHAANHEKHTVCFLFKIMWLKIYAACLTRLLSPASFQSICDIADGINHHQPWLQTPPLLFWYGQRMHKLKKV